MGLKRGSAAPCLSSFWRTVAEEGATDDNVEAVIALRP